MLEIVIITNFKEIIAVVKHADPDERTIHLVHKNWNVGGGKNLRIG
jgi:hypothetical protein